MNDSASNSSRYFSLWCPSWPVVSVWLLNGGKTQTPTVVFDTDTSQAHVIATCPVGYAEGIRRGMRKRSAEATTPDANFVVSDPASETKTFDAVLNVVRDMVPRVSIVRPGRLECDAKGPSRYFGGEQDAGKELIKRVGAIGVEDVFVGVADTRFAAYVAARLAPYSEENIFIAPSGKLETLSFLAPQPLALLDAPEVTSLISRVGLSTLGDIAEISEGDMLARFGEEGVVVHHLVVGYEDERDSRTISTEHEDIEEVYISDDPLISSEQAGFVAKQLAHKMSSRLSELGLACSELEIETHLSSGETCIRSWRVETSAFEHVIAKRVLLQCEEWLNRRGNEEVSFADREIVDSYPRGIIRVIIRATHVMSSHRRQISMFGADPATDDDALRTLSRIKTIVGDDSISELVPTGGRMPSEIVQLREYMSNVDELNVVSETLFGDENELSCQLFWPGSIVGRVPMCEYIKPMPARLLDKRGEPIKVHANGIANAEPAFLESALVGGRVEVTNFAGPWPLEDRWWDGSRRRFCRYQINIDNSAFLARTSSEVFIDGWY